MKKSIKVTRSRKRLGRKLMRACHGIMVQTASMAREYPAAAYELGQISQQMLQATIRSLKKMEGVTK